MIRWIRILVLLGTKSIALRAATIDGVVRDPAGYPIEDRPVWTVTEDCLQSRRAVTDKTGHYAFEELPPGTYKVFATQPGLWQRERTVRVGSDSTNNVDLQLVISDARHRWLSSVNAPTRHRHRYQ
jgi:hypothetical protein